MEYANDVYPRAQGVHGEIQGQDGNVKDIPGDDDLAAAPHIHRLTDPGTDDDRCQRSHADQDPLRGPGGSRGSAETDSRQAP